MTPGERAEARIAELGITEPRDIDVDAIAYDARMLVEYEVLEGSEAILRSVSMTLLHGLS